MQEAISWPWSICVLANGMNKLTDIPLWWLTLRTLALAACGAGVGWALNVPAYLLTGPACFVSLAGLAGVRLELHPLIRDAAFLVIGIGIGSTVTAKTLSTLATWPMAFAVLVLSLAVTMGISQWVLRKGFGFDARSAVLASAPGHLSYVIGLSAEMGIDAFRVTIVQLIRLLLLTLIVPYLARAMGVEITAQPLSQGGALPWATFAVLLGAGLICGMGMQAARIPAPLLIGAMSVSAVAHATDLAQGGLDPSVGLVAFVVLGGLIGTRFSGITFAALRSALGAGVAITALGSAVAVLAAIGVSAALGLPLTTVIAAFAPGGFETMIALGAVLGANPGFVAACHVARLMVLTGLIPLSLALFTRRA